jgi:acyl carrier protein
MELHERLVEVFRQVFDDDNLTLTDETTADDISEWDSVAHINLMFTIEQEFGVRFNGNELAELKNIGTLKTYLRDKGVVNR